MAKSINLDALLWAATETVATRNPNAATPARELEAQGWEPWLRGALGYMFLDKKTGEPAPFAPHQEEFWRWAWDMEVGVRPPAFVGLWSRGHGKSASGEGAVCMLAARNLRKYGLYISRTQEQADDHLGNISIMLQSEDFSKLYPDCAERQLNKYRQSQGWNATRLTTRSGFRIDSIGLDKAVRGVRYGRFRPDFLVLDDLDDVRDDIAAVDRKVQTLTKSVLPTGASDMAVLFIQNLIHEESIAARLKGIASVPADFLHNRIVSGPIPALLDMQALQKDPEQHPERWTIVAGTPTWEAFDIPRCQQEMDTIGYLGFLTECQHETRPPGGGMYDTVVFEHCDPTEIPDLVRKTVWVDPATSNTDRSDRYGIQCDGIAEDGTIYRLESWEDRTDPRDAILRAVSMATAWGADSIGFETDQGGDTWEVVYNAIVDELGLRYPPLFKSAKAGGQQTSKEGRGHQMLADYKRKGRIIHVADLSNPTYVNLEKALWRFPRTKPFDLADAAYWSWRDLRSGDNADDEEVVQVFGAASLVGSSGESYSRLDYPGELY